MILKKKQSQTPLNSAAKIVPNTHKFSSQQSQTPIYVVVKPVPNTTKFSSEEQSNTHKFGSEKNPKHP